MTDLEVVDDVVGEERGGRDSKCGGTARPRAC